MFAAWLVLGPAAQAAVSPSDGASCEGPPVDLQALSADVWRVGGAAGDSDGRNRGVISNLLLVHQGDEVWLLGAGPTPAFGRALACQLKARTGWVISDVIAPWPRPELVLGASGYEGARLWAHTEVAATMGERCPRCVTRMRQRLGEAAADLGPDPIRIAPHRLTGVEGEVGPFRWWLLNRADDTPVTVFRLRDQPLWSAHGLLWGDGPPDLRDADPAVMAASIGRLLRLSRADGDAARWLPEQGPLLAAVAPARQLAYLRSLAAAVRSAQRQGALETDAPATLDGIDASLTQGVRHSLNWQRMWALEEARTFDGEPAREEADLPHAPPAPH